MKIGEKIKRIRIEKGLSQSNLHNKQSAISQIEKGIIKTPTESILRIIAGNMDMSFDELIADTTWEPIHQSRADAEYAVSETECIVIIKDSGEIKTKMKSYPRYNESGEENKFDPDTGYNLLTECGECNRAIEKTDQTHCFGCGNRLFVETRYENFMAEKYYNSRNEEISPGPDNPFFDQELFYETKYLETDYTVDLQVNKRLQFRLSVQLANLESVDADINNHILPDEIIAKNVIQNYYYKEYFRPYAFYYDQSKKTYDVDGNEVKKTDKFDEIVNISDFRKISPREIKNDIVTVVMSWWCMHQFTRSYYRGLLNELMRHEQRIIQINQKEEGNEIKPSNPKSKEKEKS